MAEKVLTVKNLETGLTHTVTEAMWENFLKEDEAYELQKPPAKRKSTKKAPAAKKTAVKKAPESAKKL